VSIYDDLEHLANLKDHQAALELEIADKRKAILALVQIELNHLESEYAEALGKLATAITAKEAAVKAGALEIGATIKGSRLQAVFIKGRVSWDTKALDGYAMAHPEILPLRSRGEPSISIRVIK